MAKIALAHGTRPEAIKFAPVKAALEARGAQVLVYESMQSPDLVDGSPSGIIWNDGLTRGISGCMTSFRDWLRAAEPQAVLVQGDTATAFACALAAFLEGVPVGHVEAGLRTYASEPYPEEALRRMIAAVARWHFAPDTHSLINLAMEMGEGGYRRDFHPEQKRYHAQKSAVSVFVTGNPVIDTLPTRPLQVLVTLHRRENWGRRIEGALHELDGWAHATGSSVEIITHPNWSKAVTAFDPHDYIRSCLLVPPMDRNNLIHDLRLSDVVVTDSGGLQEEAAAMGVPCLVLRTSTERQALVANGAVKLIDPDRPEELRRELDLLLARRQAYGTGDAGERIATILLEQLAGRAEEAA